MMHSMLKCVETMKDASEDEQLEDFIDQPKTNARSSETKAEREQKLRQMMEDEGEARKHKMPYSASAYTTVDEDIGNATQDSVHPSTSSQEPTTTIDETKEPSPQPPAVVTGGRRRGRRKVMKKKTMKDEEGYLSKQIISCIPLEHHNPFSPLLPLLPPIPEQEA